MGTKSIEIEATGGQGKNGKKMVETHLVKILNFDLLIAGLDGKKDCQALFEKVAAVIFFKNFCQTLFVLLCFES